MSTDATPTPAPDPQPTPAGEKPKPPAPVFPPLTGSRFGSKPFKEGTRAPGGDRPRQDMGGAPPAIDFTAFKPNKRDLDKSMEAELEAAMRGLGDAGQTIVPEVRVAKGPPGKKRGRVVSIHGKDVFIDVPGGRGQGVLDILQFHDEPPKVGDDVEFDIERYDAANGLLVLTRDGAAKYVSDWGGLAYGMIIEVKVTDLNKNKTGLMVEVRGIKGFMPISQLDMYRVEKPEEYVGQKLKVMVTEVVPEERNLIVSRRAVMEKERQQKAEIFWQTLAEGQVYKGIVKSIKPFGAFVDIGGVDGLIPISELSWSRVGSAEEVVSVNQVVEVKVMRIDPETRKIGLSLKALLGNPWDDFAGQNRPGARVSGTVTRIMDFGAFVELVPGVEGLIHVSELSTERVRRVQDCVQVGQNVEVQILNLDPEQRRIALSLKAIQAAGEALAGAATQAEADADKQAALERLANRTMNPNLRGGIGGGKFNFSRD